MASNASNFNFCSAVSTATSFVFDASRAVRICSRAPNAASRPGDSVSEN
jgi:hypothetical protein